MNSFFNCWGFYIISIYLLIGLFLAIWLYKLTHNKKALILVPILWLPALVFSLMGELWRKIWRIK